MLQASICKAIVHENYSPICISSFFHVAQNFAAEGFWSHQLDQATGVPISWLW